MQGGSLSFYGGSNNTLNESIEYGQTAGNLTCYVTASELHNNIGLANPASTSEPIHDASDQTGGFIYLSYVLDEASRISLIMNGSNNAFQIPNIKGQTPVYSYQGRTTFDSAALNENQVEQSCFEVLTYQVERDDLSCQISQFTRYGSVDYKPDMAGDLMFNGVASRDDHVLVSNGLQTDASYRADKFNTIRGGLSVTVEHARVNTSNWVFPVDSSGNQTSTNAYDIIDDSSKTGYCYGCYLQDEWKATKWLTINYGARFDVYEGYTCENQLSPRINAVIEASKDTMLHLGYAKYFTPPPLYCVSQSSLEKFDGTSHEEENTQSSPAKCERCDCFDTGVTQKIGQGFQAGLDGYYKIKKNVLDEGQFGSAWIFSPYNAERGQVCGAELSLNYTYEGFSTYGNVAWSQAIAQGLTTGQFQFDPVEEQYLQTHWYHLDHDQPWTASMGASYKLHDTTVYMDALYGNGLFGGFANTQELGSYVTVNVGIVQKLKIDDKQSCKLRFDIVNVFDTVYAIRTGDGIGVYAPQYLPRRSFYAGISWEF